MATANLRAQSLRRLRDRLQLLDIYLVPSPPAPEGMMYFVGNGPGHFPFRNGPVRYLRSRDIDEILPAEVVRSILKHLNVTEDQFAGTEGIAAISLHSQATKPH